MALRLIELLITLLQLLLDFACHKEQFDDLRVGAHEKWCATVT